jgi:hypothetical protein
MFRRSLAETDRPQFLASRQKHLPAVRLVLSLISAVLLAFSSTAQIQQAWVARYNNGITNGANQAVKMALDSGGNIIVTGFSQNTNNQLGYVTIKYAPNGAQLWTARYDSTNSPTAMPTSMAVDSSNNVIVTGSALALKYDSNGNQLWTAPYAGTALTVDGTGNSYVVGFSQNFGTVKLSPQGSNIWLATYLGNGTGRTVSESVVMDSGSNVLVSGLDTYYGGPPSPYVYLTTIKYDANGNQLWKSSLNPAAVVGSVQVEATALDNWGNLYIAALPYPGNGFSIYKYALSGSVEMVSNPQPHTLENVVDGLQVDSIGNLLITGQFYYFPPGYSYAFRGYGTFKANTNGSWLWTNFYPMSGPNMSGPNPSSAALALTVDSANNSYVTGYAFGTNGTNNIVTIKYSPNGNQVWLQSYNGLNAGNDAGAGIVVDKNGNVYVTGYETLPGGGTGIVTIKYSPLTLQRKPDGTVLLETQGSPGESFDIEASIDLLNWLDLGTFIANTNGLLQFDDTNAPSFPSRFYYTNPQ